jgi:hypothetical protein
LAEKFEQMRSGGAVTSKRSNRFSIFPDHAQLQRGDMASEAVGNDEAVRRVQTRIGPVDVQRAMDAIYNEDPAVLRARQRKVLAGYGLSPAEVARFGNALLLTPTRQSILVEDAKLPDASRSAASFSGTP